MAYAFLILFVLFLQQIAELKKNIEDEKKKSKDLASTNVKLNGIIKTGHDALTQEQGVVQELKKQLQDKSKVIIITQSLTCTVEMKK